MSGLQRRVSALLIGASGTGKTHFGAQLLGRLNAGGGRLAMRGAADDLALFEEALRRLNQGLSASHTPAGQFREITLPLVDRKTGTALDLTWPDYAGEQVTQIVLHREVSEDWQRRARVADAWILVVRPQHMVTPEDAISRPVGDAARRSVSPESYGAELPVTNEKLEAESWSDQARLVELLQLLLSATHTGTRDRIQTPKLVVLLSCWDELEGTKPTRDAEGHLIQFNVMPDDLFATYAPLVANFISANWAANAHESYGLSSLGRSLRPDLADGDYADVGPEHFGYVVLEDGRVENDLTQALVPLTGSGDGSHHGR